MSSPFLSCPFSKCVNSLSSCLMLKTGSLINSCLVILQSSTERWETLANNYKRLINDRQTRHKGRCVTRNGGGWRNVIYERHSPAGRHEGEVGCSVGGEIAWAVQWAAPCKHTEILAMAILGQAKDLTFCCIHNFKELQSNNMVQLLLNQVHF